MLREIQAVVYVKIDGKSRRNLLYVDFELIQSANKHRCNENTIVYCEHASRTGNPKVCIALLACRHGELYASMQLQYL